MTGAGVVIAGGPKTRYDGKEFVKAGFSQMSIHINAKKGEIADTILLPGDPLRAKYIAETFLEDVVQFNEVRNMFGYTGVYKGKRVSVMGTGMGIPSISIYITELMQEYDVQKLIRVGTCGAIQKDVKVRDVIIAQSASTNSKFNEITFKGMDYAPTADFDLLLKAYETGREKGLNLKVGNVFTEDLFYSEDSDHKKYADYGVLAVEMESAALFIVSAVLGIRAGTILLVGVNPELKKAGINEGHCNDTDRAIKIAIEALRKIIRNDKK